MSKIPRDVEEYTKAGEPCTIIGTSDLNELIDLLRYVSDDKYMELVYCSLTGELMLEYVAEVAPLTVKQMLVTKPKLNKKTLIALARHNDTIIHKELLGKSYLGGKALDIIAQQYDTKHIFIDEIINHPNVKTKTLVKICKEMRNRRLYDENAS